jgi:hypothetical protein
VTDRLEELTRAAPQRRANDAVPADRVRAALPRRAVVRRNRRRSGTFAIGAAAAAVAGALIIPTVLVGHHGGGRPTGSAPGVVAAPPNQPGPSQVPTELTVAGPTWLPPGLTERARQTNGSGVKQTIVRTWSDSVVGTDGAGGHGLRVTTDRSSPSDYPGTGGGKAVDINGVTGYYTGPVSGDDKSLLAWRTNAKTVVTIEQVDLSLSEAQLLHIARSFTAQVSIGLTPLTLGWVPDHMTFTGTEVSGDSPTKYLAEVTLEAVPPSGAPGTRTPATADPDLKAPMSSAGASALGEEQRKESKTGPDSLSVMVSPTTLAPAGGTPTTVNGHPARLITRTDLGMDMHGWYLVVTLAPHQYLTILAISAQTDLGSQLTRVAENVTVQDGVANWIGTR